MDSETEGKGNCSASYSRLGRLVLSFTLERRGEKCNLPSRLSVTSVPLIMKKGLGKEM